MAFVGIKIFVSVADGQVVKVTADGGALSALGPVIDIVDGNKHKIAVVIKDDLAQVFVDGVGGTPDTSGLWSIGDNDQAIDIGEDHGGVTQVNGLISNLKIYEKCGTKP